jgi:pimeloyl-ACP methyl ester carboxylesterase
LFRFVLFKGLERWLQGEREWLSKPGGEVMLGGRERQLARLRQQALELRQLLSDQVASPREIGQRTRRLTQQARRLGVNVWDYLPDAGTVQQQAQEAGRRLRSVVPPADEARERAAALVGRAQAYASADEIEALVQRALRLGERALTIASATPLLGRSLRSEAAKLQQRAGLLGVDLRSYLPVELVERLGLVAPRLSWPERAVARVVSPATRRVQAAVEQAASRFSPVQLSPAVEQRLPEQLVAALERTGLVERPARAAFPWQRMLLGIGAVKLAAFGFLTVWSRYFVDHQLDLPEALNGLRRTLSSDAGTLSYYVAGAGEPLLLIHSVNAAASAYEVRPLFEHYKASRRVYALELPGFGFSERGDRAYTPRLYTDAILAMLDEIRRDRGADEVDAVALSLSDEFLARAAQERPGRFRSLALITPTGFAHGEQLYGAPGQTRGSRWGYRLLATPLWRQTLFDLLTTKPSIQYFLGKTFGSQRVVDQGLAEYCYLSAHQPGAPFAPYHFLSGLLWSADIDRVYESLELPVYLAYGIRGQFSNVQDLSNVRGRANWTIRPFNTGGMPYFEDLPAFIDGYDAFLERVATA